MKYDTFILSNLFYLNFLSFFLSFTFETHHFLSLLVMSKTYSTWHCCFSPLENLFKKVYVPGGVARKLEVGKVHWVLGIRARVKFVDRSMKHVGKFCNVQIWSLLCKSTRWKNWVCWIRKLLKRTGKCIFITSWVKKNSLTDSISILLSFTLTLI